ncbi:PA2778 family cysteine peptidase [Aquisalimonas sp. APHAB1-3]|uniref:PA2778 family cysteine peptidase n=1 Tax=Aquisalimonas sp. APHAB1-3 TaxID=3402080 RepID=UPI003AAB4DDC
MSAPVPSRIGGRPLLAAAALAAALLGGCASFTAIAPDDAFSDPPRGVELINVPYFPQEALQCGPAALAETLVWSGYETTPGDLKPELFIPEREGTLQTEMKAQTRARDRIPYRIRGNHDAILAELHAGNPVLVFQNLGLGWAPVWHYAVVVGYDPQDHDYILRSGEHERQLTGLDRFRRTWDRGDNWAIVVVEPDDLPATAEPANWLRAGLDLQESGRTDAATTAYESGRDRWPEHGGFHVALMNLHYGKGDADAAEAAARRGLDEAESHGGVLRNNLAMLLLERGACEEAGALAREAEASVDADSPFAGDFRETRETVRRECSAADD